MLPRLFKKFASLALAFVLLAPLLSLLRVPSAYAALASSYVVSGAGNSAYNGTYTANGTCSGVTMFSNGSYWLSYYPVWQLGPSGGCTPNYAYYNNGGSSTSVPSTGWIVNGGGTAPAPTVNAPVTGPTTTGILSPRSLTLGSSTAGTATTYQFSLTTGTTFSVGSLKFQYCTTASGTCTVPVGLSTTAATLSAQTGTSGFTLLNASNGAPYLTNASAPTLNASTALSFTLSNVTNPTSANTPFYVRVTSYAGTDGASGPVDLGTVSSSTGGQLSAYGSVGETLSFCVGTSITGVDCTSASGSSINMGAFSTTTPAIGTSMFSAATNGASGYTVSVAGTTLTNPGGTATIPALTSQTASAPGTSQFGINVAANTAPSVGAAIAGTGTAVAAATYGTTNQFRFVSGDTLASVTGPSLGNTFTVSYLANVSPLQKAGTYTANLTFVCTPTF